MILGGVGMDVFGEPLVLGFNRSSRMEVSPIRSERKERPEVDGGGRGLGPLPPWP